MKNLKIYLGCLAVAASLFTGCIPQKEYVLLQDKSTEKKYENPYNPLDNITDKYFLQPNDYLFINVSTPDPKISEFFNQNASNSGNMQRNQNFFYYQIDDSMNIDFPYVGLINLDGCNVKMGKAKVQDALKPFLKEYNLTFRLASNTFTALGEFRNQGVQTMQREQITIFEAVAQAGGITPFGKQRKLQLVRQMPEGPVTYEIDLTDKNIINSEYYYIYPNDMLYVRPMKAKQFGIGESFSIGIITTLLALYLTLQTVIN
ncbi:polysaccharide biosynthesis/export family protein [Carboxylicivirga sediminis]|uniref:Polysaccharide biosynthesis/export family protein n=1 Tax=Carboxylicivirga sediminis TaxID=2006564 RepID=A0A941IVM6_9BACT|nr:polysaccharide biosynthesis/export family protein [Carboxylicivirga sediminis]MBR8535216.1 polysaccharide biosynthesis/export family protein [Carboxylicivirga sediminis]